MTTLRARKNRSVSVFSSDQAQRIAVKIRPLGVHVQSPRNADIGKPRRIQEPVERLLQGLMMRRGRGMTVRVLMRHARLHRVVEPYDFCRATETVATTSCRIKTSSSPRKRVNGVGCHPRWKSELAKKVIVVGM